MYILEQYSKEHTCLQEKAKVAVHRKFLYYLKSHKQSMNIKWCYYHTKENWNKEAKLTLCFQK